MKRKSSCGVGGEKNKIEWFECLINSSSRVNCEFGVRKVRCGDAGLELTTVAVPSRGVGRRGGACPSGPSWPLAGGLSLAGALLLGVGYSGAPWQADLGGTDGAERPSCVLRPRHTYVWCRCAGRRGWGGAGGLVPVLTWCRMCCFLSLPASGSPCQGFQGPRMHRRGLWIWSEYDRNTS